MPLVGETGRGWGGCGRVEQRSDLCLGTSRAEVWVGSSGPWRLEPLPTASGLLVLLTLSVGPRNGSLSARAPVSEVTSVFEVTPLSEGTPASETTPRSRVTPASETTPRFGVTLSSEAGRTSPRLVCRPARLRPLSRSAWHVSPKAVAPARFHRHHLWC